MPQGIALVQKYTLIYTRVFLPCTSYHFLRFTDEIYYYTVFNILFSKIFTSRPPKFYTTPAFFLRKYGSQDQQVQSGLVGLVGFSRVQSGLVRFSRVQSGLVEFSRFSRVQSGLVGFSLVRFSRIQSGLVGFSRVQSG